MKIEDIDEVNLEQANFIINGEALNALQKLPNSLVQTVITSPPYYDINLSLWEVSFPSI
ncbi:hypothetical protein IQ231_13375 [Cuspidothrix issatschenkoi LEGE 03284]|uniref:hypothetical protein n=1 Tax=Cuspidothrix issatschenkoi TaxID=230752 RepID=UPI001882B087|nr:hypothetical protein [Cuspidothrix issatschenkoi]MBE9232643.1 hypothetical protein [Cuspidothrix issatschenkoi LEGE 03284]